MNFLRMFKKISKIKLSKNLKQYFIWPIIIAVISFGMTVIFWHYAEDSNKRNSLLEKKLTVISELTEAFYVYDYHASFRGMMNLQKLSHVKYFHQMPQNGLQTVEMSIDERIRLADSMSKMYPFVNEKMIEGDQKAPEMLKNIILAKLFFSSNVAFKADKFMEYVPIDDKINSYLRERLKKNNTDVSETEKNELLKDLEKQSRLAFQHLLQQMVSEVR